MDGVHIDHVRERDINRWLPVDALEKHRQGGLQEKDGRLLSHIGIYYIN